MHLSGTQNGEARRFPNQVLVEKHHCQTTWKSSCEEILISDSRDSVSDASSMIQTFRTFFHGMSWKQQTTKQPPIGQLIATTQGFIKGEFIGGGDDIVDLNKRGVLLEKCRLALLALSWFGQVTAPTWQIWVPISVVVTRIGFLQRKDISWISRVSKVWNHKKGYRTLEQNIAIQIQVPNEIL